MQAIAFVQTITWEITVTLDPVPTFSTWCICGESIETDDSSQIGRILAEHTYCTE